MNNKIEFEQFVEELKSGEIKVFYCSLAELFETDLCVNLIASTAIDAANNGDYNWAIDSLFNAIRNKKKISTELLVILSNFLIALNEFYFAGVLTNICRDYFIKGDFLEVAVLDKPYINIAKDIYFQSYDDYNNAFNFAIKNNFNPLINIVLKKSPNTTYSKALVKTKEEITNEIQKYFDFSNSINKKKEMADRIEKEREEAERKAKEEAEKKAKAEAEAKRKAKEEAEQKAREEAKRKAKEEAERKTREEAERKRIEEENRKAENRKNGVCQYCGGKFKGLFTKKCSVCEKEKDY